MRTGTVASQYSSENKEGKRTYSSDEGNRLRSRDEECPNIKEIRSTVRVKEKRCAWSAYNYYQR